MLARGRASLASDTPGHRRPLFFALKERSRTPTDAPMVRCAPSPVRISVSCPPACSAKSAGINISLTPEQPHRVNRLSEGATPRPICSPGQRPGKTKSRNNPRAESPLYHRPPNCQTRLDRNPDPTPKIRVWRRRPRLRPDRVQSPEPPPNLHETETRRASGP